MDNMRFYNSFVFVRFSFQSAKHTDNMSGINTNYIARINKGKGIIKTKDNNTITVMPGDVFYLPLGLKYESDWFPSDNGEETVEWDSFSFVNIPTNEGDKYEPQKLSLSQNGKKMLDLLCSDMTVSASSVGLLYFVLGDALPKMTRKVKDSREALLESAKRYIVSSPSFTVPDLARYCHMSESAVYAFFRNYAHTTPIEFKNAIQIDNAVNLLGSTDLTVEEISERIGFKSTVYFRKILKDRTGKTPTEIRKEQFMKNNV